MSNQIERGWKGRTPRSAYEAATGLPLEHVHEWDMEFQTCVFGCNSKVDEDTGICPTCKDHSVNVVTCSICEKEGEVDPFTNIVTER